MCTNLSIRTGTGPGPLVTARTMDETPELPSVVQLVPKGTKLLSGTTSIPFVGVGFVLDTKFPNVKPLMYADGMNTSGLSAGALWLPDTQYPASGPNPLPDMAVCGWALGNYENVADVAAGLKSHTVVEETTNRGPIASLLHWVFVDAAGDVLIAEYIDGALNLYNPQPPKLPACAVLTNSPPYPWHTTNVANVYDNLTLTNVATKVQNQEINGSGMLGAPGDGTPPSRFVRSWFFSHSTYLPAKPTTQYWIGVALQMIETAIVPYGTIMTSKGALGDHTQWGVVRDHANKVFYFFSAFNNTLYAVDLNAIKFPASISGIPLDQPTWFTPAPF